MFCWSDILIGIHAGSVKGMDRRVDTLRVTLHRYTIIPRPFFFLPCHVSISHIKSLNGCNLKLTAGRPSASVMMRHTGPTRVNDTAIDSSVSDGLQVRGKMSWRAMLEILRAAALSGSLLQRLMIRGSVSSQDHLRYREHSANKSQ